MQVGTYLREQCTGWLISDRQGKGKAVEAEIIRYIQNKSGNGGGHRSLTKFRSAPLNVEYILMFSQRKGGK